jgi:hypothetical protein
VCKSKGCYEQDALVARAATELVAVEAEALEKHHGFTKKCGVEDGKRELNVAEMARAVREAQGTHLAVLHRGKGRK